MTNSNDGAKRVDWFADSSWFSFSCQSNSANEEDRTTQRTSTQSELLSDHLYFAQAEKPHK